MREHVFVPQINRESGPLNTHFHLVLRKPAPPEGAGVGAPASPPSIKGALSQSLSSLRRRHSGFPKIQMEGGKDSHSEEQAASPQGHPLHRGAREQDRRQGGLSPNYLLSLSPSFLKGEGDSISKVPLWSNPLGSYGGSDLLILGEDDKWRRRT